MASRVFRWPLVWPARSPRPWPGGSWRRQPSGVPKGGAWLFLALAAGLALVSGAAVAVGYWLPAAVLVVGAVWSGYFLLRLAMPAGAVTVAADSWFWGLLVLVPGISLLAKTTGVNLGMALEAGLLAALPLTLAAAGRWFAASAFARRWSLLFAAFLLVSLLSSLLGRSQLVAAGFQFFTNLKFLYVLIFGYALVWSPRSRRAFWGLARWAWIPLLALVAWQWLHPGSYLAAFPARSLHGHPLTLLPSQAVGPFLHPSILANYSALLFIVVYVGQRLGLPAAGGWIGTAALPAYLLLLLGSGERQELLGLMAVLLAWEIQRLSGLRRALALLANLAVGLILAGAFFLLYQQSLTRELDTWGLSGGYVSTQHEHPRAAIYRHSFAVADGHFPLGSGLGTYGSAAAEKFDDSLYADLGFARYPWYGRENYLMDTYWPAFVAETGWIGALLLLACYGGWWRHAGRQMRAAEEREAAAFWGLAYTCLGYFLVLSATSPAFQDPVLFLLPGALMGIAARHYGKEEG